jgi:MerR family transcriptional regulator, light-induced transcriptional regulator
MPERNFGRLGFMPARDSVRLDGEQDYWLADMDESQSLARTIESEIIPRLMLMHRLPKEREDAPPREPLVPTAADVEALTRLSIATDPAAALAFVRSVEARGVTAETVCLELLTPAARRLGWMWEEDLCDFTDVTIGLSHLHRLLHEINPGFRNDNVKPTHGRRAIIAPVGDEQHTFGLAMVVEFFRQAGWNVWGWPLAVSSDVLRLVKNGHFDMVGLSVSCDTNLVRLKTEVAAIRAASQNVDIKVLVGGRVFVEKPELVAEVGADATASHAAAAVTVAERHVGVTVKP